LGIDFDQSQPGGAQLDRTHRRTRSSKHPAIGAPAIVDPRLIWINSGSRVFRKDFSIRGAIAMPIETAVMLFAIVIPFALFAGVLGWAQSRTK
jgi:hypothetical protein